MIFMDGIVLIDEDHRGVNTKLMIWRQSLESKRIRLTTTKIEHFEYKFSKRTNKADVLLKLDTKDI